jgi:hypothetical protein
MGQEPQDIIEISSDESESEPEAKLELEKTKQTYQSLSKKRTLSESTLANKLNSPRKRQLTKAEVIEVFDSDNDSDVQVPTINLKAEILPISIPNSPRSKPQTIKALANKVTVTPVSEELKPPIKDESSIPTESEFKLEINESAKDSDGRYIVTKKVKVDGVEVLSEVPKRWPVPPEDTTVAYVINLNEDKRWRESKDKGHKGFDPFLKQEVTSISKL